VQLPDQADAAGVVGVAAGEAAGAGEEPAGLGFPVEDDGSGDRLQEDPGDARLVRVEQVRDRCRFRGERLGFLGSGCRRSVAREAAQVITLVRVEPQGRREGVQDLLGCADVRPCSRYVYQVALMPASRAGSSRRRPGVRRRPVRGSRRRRE
jgi:hypothetical protein